MKPTSSVHPQEPPVKVGRPHARAAALMLCAHTHSRQGRVPSPMAYISLDRQRRPAQRRAACKHPAARRGASRPQPPRHPRQALSLPALHCSPTAVRLPVSQALSHAQVQAQGRWAPAGARRPPWPDSRRPMCPFAASHALLTWLLTSPASLSWQRAAPQHVVPAGQGLRAPAQALR